MDQKTKKKVILKESLKKKNQTKKDKHIKERFYSFFLVRQKKIFKYENPRQQQNTKTSFVSNTKTSCVSNTKTSCVSNTKTGCVSNTKTSCVSNTKTNFWVLWGGGEVENKEKKQKKKNNSNNN